MSSDSESPWVPKQEKTPDVVDFRCLAYGPKGFKESKKRRHEEQEIEEEQNIILAENQEVIMEDAPSLKRQKASETNWRPVSGKVWKQPGTRASLVMKPKTGKSWEKKMEEKAVNKMLLEKKREAITALKGRRKAVADQKRKALELKKVNREKSAVVQTITKTSTLKKMMKNKKQRKLLKTAA